VKIGSIVVSCCAFEAVLTFWSEALGSVPREAAATGWVVLKDPKGVGPNLSVNRVAEKRTGKRSRLHLDLYTGNPEAEVERLAGLGATRYPWRYRPGADFVVREDPDGNLFCVVRKSAG
jgi:hypothetical protein